MQPDGNLVVYSTGQVAQFHTGTVGSDGANLRLQDDSNLVVELAGRPLWSWMTGKIT